MNEPVPTVLRLVTGEDIIADTVFINEAGNSRYVISDPLKIVYLPLTKDTHISISLMQWMFTRISDNQTFELKDRDVLIKTDPSDSLCQYYYKTVEYFYEIREEQVKKMAMGTEKLKNELYEEIAMSEDEEIHDLMDSDEMKEVMEYLKKISKDDKGTLH